MGTFNLRPPRVADDNQREPAPRRRTNHCAVCGIATREGKSHCTEHVLEMDYASRVAKIEESARREVENVEERGPEEVNLNGIVVDEIISGIDGSTTWRRLVKERVTYLMRAEPETADKFLARLVDEGLVFLTRNRRRSVIPHLTEKGYATPAAMRALV